MNDATFKKAQEIKNKIERLEEASKSIFDHINRFRASEDEKIMFHDIVKGAFDKKIKLYEKDFEIL